MDWRGSADYLYMRRRTATLGDMAFAIVNPQTYPKVYGCLGAFGSAPPNPSLLILEALTPLSEIAPGEHLGIPNSKLGVSRQTGSSS